MAFVLADRVKETTTYTGGVIVTTVIPVAGPVAQFQSFVAGVGNTNRTYFGCESGDGTSWIVGTCDVAAGTPDQLTVASIIVTSAGFTGLSGTSTIFCDAPAILLLLLAALANNTVLGNVSGSTGIASALSQAQLTGLINVFTATLSGAVPASGGGTTNFLRADGTWAAPPGGGISQLTGDVTAGPGSGSQAATIAASAVTTSKINNAAVTYAKIQNGSVTGLLGVNNGAAPSEVTVDGTTVVLLGGVLSAVGSGGGAPGSVSSVGTDNTYVSGGTITTSGTITLTDMAKAVVAMGDHLFYGGI